VNRRWLPLAAAWVGLCLLMTVPGAWRRLPEFMAAFDMPGKLPAELDRQWSSTITSLVWAALFWLAATECGSSGLAWLRVGRAGSPAERHPVAAAVGFALYASGVMALGLCGLLFGAVAALLIATLVVLGVRGWRRSPIQAPATAPSSPGWLPRCALTLGLLLACFSLSPETWIDSFHYHLAAPQDFGKLHKWIDIHQDMYRYPLLAESLYSQGLLVGGESLALMLNLSGALLVGWLLWGWATRVAGPAAGWLALMALLASDQIGFHMGHANEGFYSMAFAFLGVWAWHTAAVSGGPPARLMLAGAALGWALCAKYTAAVPLVGIAAWHALRAVRAPRREIAALGWIAAGGALAGAPFLLNGWLFTGNPVYPFFFGGLHWESANDRLLQLFGCPGVSFEWNRPADIARTVRDILVLQTPLLMLALPAVMIRFRLRSPLLWAWGGAVATWAIAIPCVRLTMPVYPALALLAGASLAPLVTEKGPARRWAGLAVGALFAAGAVQAVTGADFGKRSFAAAIGVEPRAAYLSRVLTTYEDAVEQVNLLVPSGGRVLVVGDIRGYGFRPLMLNRDIEDMPAMYEFARGCGSPDNIGRRVRQTGARYLLFNFVTSEHMGTYYGSEFIWRPAALRNYHEYWRRHAVELWRSVTVDHENGGFVLYRLDRAAHPPDEFIPFLPGTEGMLARGRRGGKTAPIGALLEAMNTTPGVGHLANLAAFAYREGGLWDAAYRYYAATTSRGMIDDENWYGFALTGLVLKRFDESAKAFQYAWDLYPARRHLIDGSLATLELERGDALADARRWHEAAQSYRRCLEALDRLEDGTEPQVQDKVLALLRLSRALLAAGQRDEAAAQYDQAIRILPRAWATLEARQIAKALGRR